MRIAVVNHHGRTAAGAEHALMLFIAQLAPDVHPEFFLFEEGEFTQSLRERGQSVTVINMSQRVATATRKDLPYTAVLDSLSVAFRLAKSIRAMGADLVLTNSMKAHVIGSIAAKLAGVKCINYVHDMLDGKALGLIRFISRFCAASRFVCSQAVGSALGLSNTVVLYSPIELAHFENLPSRAAALSALHLPQNGLPLVGLVGRIARWKGQDKFIRIAARTLERVDAHFVIVGSPIFGCDDAYVPELRALATSLNIADRIHFVPWQNDLRAVYAALDVACSCSTREPFGLTTVEALACNVPVICFDDAGVCEIFSDNQGGRIVNAGDERAFSDALTVYLLSPNEREKASSYGAKIIEMLEPSAIGERFRETIDRFRPRASASVAARPSASVAAPFMTSADIDINLHSSPVGVLIEK